MQSVQLFGDLYMLYYNNAFNMAGQTSQINCIQKGKYRKKINVNSLIVLGSRDTAFFQHVIYHTIVINHYFHGDTKSTTDDHALK